MPALTLQRCLHHPDREAVARCPECGRYFCRECITEHEDRVICASCLQDLAKLGAEKRSRRWRLTSVLPVAGALAGLLAAWLSFYMVGRALLTMPSHFHTELWKHRLFDMSDD